MIINLEKEIIRGFNTTTVEEVERGVDRAKHAVLSVLSVLDNGGPEDKFSEELFSNLLIELKRCEQPIEEHNVLHKAEEKRGKYVS